MIIQIPDELARGLEGIAAAQHKTVQQVALENLRSLVYNASPQTLLHTLQLLTHPSAEAVDALEAAIAAAELPVRDSAIFQEPAQE